MAQRGQAKPMARRKRRGGARPAQNGEGWIDSCLSVGFRSRPLERSVSSITAFLHELRWREPRPRLVQQTKPPDLVAAFGDKPPCPARIPQRLSSSKGQTRRKTATQSHGPSAARLVAARLPKGWAGETTVRPRMFYRLGSLPRGTSARDRGPAQAGYAGACPALFPSFPPVQRPILIPAPFSDRPRPFAMRFASSDDTEDPSKNPPPAERSRGKTACPSHGDKAWSVRAYGWHRS
jgi:hypothetical protein